MNWFERHLNWSLVLGFFYIPLNIGATIGVIVGIAIVIIGLINYGFGPELQLYLSGLEQNLGGTFGIVIGIGTLLLDIGAIIAVMLWYLRRKGRSGWFILLLFAPPLLGFAVTFFLGIAGVIIAFGGPIIGFIILLLLGNHAGSYGVDFTGELATNQWQDTGPYTVPDDRQLKVLDYTPDKNVMDISGGADTKDITGVRDVSAADVAGQEVAAEEKVIEKPVRYEPLKMPILLDDAGAGIMCFYHPGADAVNLCSRCKQYVCGECNYISGTHPICRNCWERRADIPIAPPAKKQIDSTSVKPEKQKVVESAKPEKQEDQEPGEPEKQKDKEPGKQEKQKITAPGKSAKLDAEKSEWLPEFMALYEQAAPIINVVIRKSDDGMPASPLDLMEGLKLRPMLERAKKLSKPKDKELREAKNEFEQVLSRCVKIADAAADFVSGGGQALLGGPDFKHIVDGIETANGLMEKLSRRLASFALPQE